jgi:hypothetical protein
MKRKKHTSDQKRPAAPRVEPKARELEAEIFAVAFPAEPRTRLLPF